MAKDTDRMARAMTYSAISRDFQLITLTSVIANLVTLYVISIGTEAKLATSVVIISILVFALLSGINQMDTFKNWIDDMDEREKEEDESGLGFAQRTQARRKEGDELKVNVSNDEVDRLIKEYKKIKKNQKSNFGQIKKLGLVDKHGNDLNAQ